MESVSRLMRSVRPFLAGFLVVVVGLLGCRSTSVTRDQRPLVRYPYLERSVTAKIPGRVDPEAPTISLGGLGFGGRDKGVEGRRPRRADPDATRETLEAPARR